MSFLVAKCSKTGFFFWLVFANQHQMRQANVVLGIACVWWVSKVAQKCLARLDRYFSKATGGGGGGGGGSLNDD